MPANAECKPRETDDTDELARWYLDTARRPREHALTRSTDARGQRARRDRRRAQLDQALLLARAPERRDQRKEIERLLGDVEYWRASREADAPPAARSLDAAKQFDAAAAQAAAPRRRRVGVGAFVRKLVDELKVGPDGAPPAPAALPAGAAPLADEPATPRVPAPPGVALPVEGGSGSGAPPPAAVTVSGGGGVLL